MTLTGITLIKDGNRLNYPWKECILSMASYCDEVIVNVGASSDGTLEDFWKLQRQDQKIKRWPILSTWDMKNTGDGSELARQANLILPVVSTDWVVYLQADEFLHPTIMNLKKEYIEKLPPTITQLEFWRTYFYGDLQHRKRSEELYLGRMFRTGTHTIGGDGMYLNRLSGEVDRPIPPIDIFHYSRIGTEQQITTRVRNLDRLFHPEETVESFAPFKYDMTDLVTYSGPHPAGVAAFYDKYK